MLAKQLDRRQFLFATTALAGAAGAVAIAGTSAAQCAALHARVATEFAALTKSASFAAGNVRSMVMDIICPCCGKPLFNFA